MRSAETRICASLVIAALAAVMIFVLMPADTVLTQTPAGQPLNCDLSQYKAQPGLTAVVEQDALAVTWSGTNGSELRARYGITNGQPIVRELAVRKNGGQWAPLGQNLTPEIYVKSGVRRMTTQQGAPLINLGVDITPEVIEKDKWYAFWDAPFVIPGVAPEPARQRTRRGAPHARVAPGAGNPVPHRRASRQRDEATCLPGPDGRVYGLPRKPEEIKTADATFKATSCTVKTDGARVEVNFPGLSMGIFSGSLQFTSYRGSNLFRMEAIAKTDEPSVAYKYEGRAARVLDRAHAAGQLARSRWRPAAV